MSVRDFGFSSKVREVSDVNKMLQPRKSERDISKLVKPKGQLHSPNISRVQKKPHLLHLYRKFLPLLGMGSTLRILQVQPLALAF